MWHVGWEWAPLPTPPVSKNNIAVTSQCLPVITSYFYTLTRRWSTEKAGDIEHTLSTRGGLSKSGSPLISQKLKAKCYNNSENDVWNRTQIRACLWPDVTPQPTWELHLYPAPCNRSVITSHCTAFLFNNSLAVFHIRWIIQQQTVFLFLTMAATMFHTSRVLETLFAEFLHTQQ